MGRMRQGAERLRRRARARRGAGRIPKAKNDALTGDGFGKQSDRNQGAGTLLGNGGRIIARRRQ